MLLVLPLTLAAGCAFGTTTSSGGSPATHSRPSPPRLTRYHGVTFTFPAAWRFRSPGVYSNMTSPVVDISSQPTTDPCTPSGCSFPVRHLRRGGVVVEWETAGAMIDPTHPPRPGTHIRVIRQGCHTIGGGKELGAEVILRDGRVYQAYACLRGPGAAAHEREVRDMFASARRFPA